MPRGRREAPGERRGQRRAGRSARDGGSERPRAAAVGGPGARGTPGTERLSLPVFPTPGPGEHPRFGSPGCWKGARLRAPEISAPTVHSNVWGPAGQEQEQAVRVQGNTPKTGLALGVVAPLWGSSGVRLTWKDAQLAKGTLQGQGSQGTRSPQGPLAGSREQVWEPAERRSKPCSGI